MSLLGALPCENRSNFSVAVTAKKTSASNKIKPTTKAPALYTPTHDTAPPSNQVITTEKTDLLFRKLLQKQEGLGGHKREADEKAEVQERRAKQPKTSRADERSKGKERRSRDDDEEEEEEGEAESRATIVVEEDEDEEAEEESTNEKKSRRKKVAPSGAARKKRKTDE